METTGATLDIGHRLLAGAGAGLQLVAGFYVAISSLVAPPWGVAVLAAVWLATTIWAVRSWRNHRFAALTSFGTMTAFWVVFLLVGDAFFGFGA